MYCVINEDIRSQVGFVVNRQGMVYILSFTLESRIAFQGTILKSTSDNFRSALHLRQHMGPQFDILLMILMNEGCRKSFQDGNCVDEFASSWGGIFVLMGCPM